VSLYEDIKAEIS